MDAVRKYLFDYFRYNLSLFVAGRKNYEAWKAKNYSLKKVRIKNKALCQELETACAKSGGFLTFAEFLTIDQFGVNGYHARHKDHGITPTHNHWGKAIAKLCVEHNIFHVLELGPGKGDLAIKLLQAARKNNVTITWSGIELNTNLHEQITTTFKKHGFEKNLGELATTLQQLKTKTKSIIVFSYSLDSIAPEIFVNTQNNKHYPNGLIGVTVEQGIAQEILITSSMLKKKDTQFENGIFKDQNGLLFDLSSWKLYPWQRAFISVAAFATLIQFVKRFENSIFVIIDEFQPPSSVWDTNHLGFPKDLFTYKRTIENLEKLYADCGSILLYYPLYFVMWYKFIQLLGFDTITYDIEQKMAKDLTYEQFVSTKKYYLTCALIAQNKKDHEVKTIPLAFPQATLF